MSKHQVAIGIAALTLTAVLHARAVEAAPITWQAPVDDTGNPSDILTTGSLVGSAYSFSSTSLTLNGVTFDGYTSCCSTLNFANGSDITLLNAAGVVGTGSLPGGWDPTYQSLVMGGAAQFSSGGPLTINIAGLTAGRGYVVQILEPVWDSNWATDFTAGGNTSALVNLSGADEGAGASSVPQYIVGTFTADSSTETITLGSPLTWDVFGAMQVRTAAESVPEPSPLLLLLSAALGVVMLRRRTMATPTTRALS